jgi:hypothetical protein
MKTKILPQLGHLIKYVSRAVLLAFLMLIGNQCRDSVDLANVNSPQGYLEPSTVKDQLTVKMAKLLAAELTSETMREFVKQSALKKFDEDYNFLFADAYPNLLDNTKYASFIDSVLRFHPLMQVVVPELFTVIPENWDTKNHVPAVVALPENHTPGVDTLVAAYNANGEKHFLTTLKDPKNTIIVISENVRTKFYKRGQEPSFGKMVAGGRVCQCARMLTEPDKLTTTSYGSYFLLKQVTLIENIALNGCSGCGDGGGGGSLGGGSVGSTPICQRDGSPNASDIIGKMKFQSLDTWDKIVEWTKSGADYKMVILHGGANGTAAQTINLPFYLTRHQLKSCDFLVFSCYPIEASVELPTITWERYSDGEQMLYSLYALGSGNSKTISVQFSPDNKTTFGITRTLNERDFEIAERYVKYCDTVYGDGTRYNDSPSTYAWFTIHR